MRTVTLCETEEPFRGVYNVQTGRGVYVLMKLQRGEKAAAHVLIRINHLRAHYAALNRLMISFHDYRVLMTILNALAPVSLTNPTDKYAESHPATQSTIQATSLI